MAANNIACHLANVTYETKLVDRMILNFKCDAAGRLWFLWCSALRLKHSERGKLIATKQIDFPEFILKSDKIQVQYALKKEIVRQKEHTRKEAARQEKSRLIQLKRKDNDKNTAKKKLKVIRLSALSNVATDLGIPKDIERHRVSALTMVTKRAGTPQPLIKDAQCPRCFRIMPSKDAYEVSFAMIIN